MNVENNYKNITIVDFGGQYAHLLAQTIRKLKIYSKIVCANNFTTNSNTLNNCCGVIFSGGPESVLNGYDDHFHQKINDLMSKGIPILGICYGHQLLAHAFNGKIIKGTISQYGKSKITINHSIPSPLFKLIPANIEVWMSHMDYVTKLNDSFLITSYAQKNIISSFEMKNYPLFGVQFHPEVTHSNFGEKILDNFINICLQQLDSSKRTKDWDNEIQIKNIIELIKDTTKNKKLVILVSGGVDSLVALKLCLLAKDANQIIPLHIDTGFLRLNESKEVLDYLKSLNIPNIMFIDAKKYFHEKLTNVTDAEEKRKIIGEAFIEVVNNNLDFDLKSSDTLLVQGTIYPDTIESGTSSSRAHTIKTHHNRVEGILKLISTGQIIEPLANLYKDEVRNIGKILNIDKKLINRKPFPGPGLAIRIIAQTTSTINFDNEYDLPLVPLEVKGIILPIKSVGVQGDQRSFKNPFLIYKNETIIDSLKFKNISHDLINKISTINRVIWAPFDDLSFIKELKIKENLLNEKNVSLLQEVDYQVEDLLTNNKCFEIWQSLTVSLPLFDNNNNQIFVLRAVTSVNAMTADGYDFSQALLNEINLKIRKIKGVASIWFDKTSKPPATIEWE
ncbi:MAG: glutamine-hydrolyzing GMP synthase [Oligoflexia bacterium]|nr:glutamine-hydrolyzing GMP synthase [Oligoflexia bacterium]